MASEDKNVIKYLLCKKDDMKNEEMKACEVVVNDETFEILLVKSEDKFFAVGSRCSHYDLPLKKGCYFKGRIRCYAHGACFNVKTGDIEDFPGMDCIPTYNVVIEDDNVYIKTTLEILKTKKIVKTPIKRAASARTVSARKKEVCVIIGSGAGGLMCAEALREESYDGKIIMLTKETYHPYYRPKLSKILDIPITHPLMVLRNDEFYKKYNVEYMPNTEVTGINIDDKNIEYVNNKIKFDKLVIATGMKAVKPEVPGIDLKGVFTVRSLDEANEAAKYAESLKAQKESLSIAVIGASFMALESSTFFQKFGEVTIYCRKKPFLMQFGEKVSEKICQLHENKNVKIVVDNLQVKELRADQNDESKLGSIYFADDRSNRCMATDICIFAIGSKPVTELLDRTKFKMTEKGFVEVDEFMQTSVPCIYAVGDITTFPTKCLQGFSNVKFKSNMANLQHWQMSCAQGKTAGYHIVGLKDKGLRTVPFLWSQNYSTILRFAGYFDHFDDIIFHDLSDEQNQFKFVAFYLIGNIVTAICSCNMDPICSVAAEIFYNDMKITKESVLNDPWGFKGNVSLLDSN